MNWKIISIIFIVIFIVENLFIGISIYLANQEEKKINMCLYDYCEEQRSADVVDGICYCYDYDVLGNLEIVKERPLSLIND